MKITIKNFGPIDHFEFDLEKDLHVIYGENNIGKSWAISVVYLLLKSWKVFLQKDRKKNTAQFQAFDWQIEDFSEKFNNILNTTFNEKRNLLSKKEPEFKIGNIDISRTKVRDRNEGMTFNILPIVDFENIYFLPASKSGIYQVLSNMGNIFAQLSQYQLKNTSLNLPSMSEPVADYILNIGGINNSKQGEFGSFVDFLEEKVIEGSVVFDDFQKKLKYKSNRTGLVSELHEASSMIAEISPLVAYLKYILPKKNSILFIEEPEAHLHPKVQVEMMKVFVDLAKAGVKVVMTTHSDFMMNELTNLLLEKKIDADKVGSYHLVMGEKGSFDAGDMKATSEGIEDYNFTDVAVEQYERRMNILEKLNQEHAFTEDSAR